MRCLSQFSKPDIYTRCGRSSRTDVSYTVQSIASSPARPPPWSCSCLNLLLILDVDMIHSKRPYYSCTVLYSYSLLCQWLNGRTIRQETGPPTDRRVERQAGGSNCRPAGRTADRRDERQTGGSNCRPARRTVDRRVEPSRAKRLNVPL